MTRAFPRILVLIVVVACRVSPGAEPAGPPVPETAGAGRVSSQPATSSGRERLPLGTPGAHAAGADAPKVVEPESLGWQAARTIGSLSLVLGLAGAVAWGFRRMSARTGLMGAIGPAGKAPSGVLHVLGRFPVSRGATLILLKLDRRILLVSQTSSRAGSSMATLCELSSPEDVASILLKVREEEGDVTARRFHTLLNDADRQMVQPIAAHPPARQSPAMPAPARTQGRTQGHGAAALRGRLESVRASGRSGLIA